jgi:phosphoribosylglycinamide formyltransferase 1
VTVGTSSDRAPSTAVDGVPAVRPVGALAARLGVLASGSGTILEAILGAGLLVRVVVVDRPCRAIEVADRAGVSSALVDRNRFGGFGSAFDRDGFTAALTEELVRHRIEVVAMAGFGTVLGQRVHSEFPGRILNTHPALLPLFPGWHAVEDALAAGATETGTTVHVATLEMDAGPILAQQAVPILAGDSVEVLHERIKSVERVVYPDAIRRFIDGLATQPGRERGSSQEVER